MTGARDDRAGPHPPTATEAADMGWSIWCDRGTVTDARQSSGREWLVTNGRGAFAMGTISGRRTRRYHGLLVVPKPTLEDRHLGIVALEPTLVVNGQRHRLTADADGLAPYLERFEVADGIPRWTYAVGITRLRRELAMEYGTDRVVIAHTLLGGPDEVEVEVELQATWRGIHSEGRKHEFTMYMADERVVLEGGLVVRGEGFTPSGKWLRDVPLPEEAARGYRGFEDVFVAGHFRAGLRRGVPSYIDAGDLMPESTWRTPLQVLAAARERATLLGERAGCADDTERVLVHAADQFVIRGPDVIAGYPWFGVWSRDALVSYEGLFLETRRLDEGRSLLLNMADRIRDGVMVNTREAAGPLYNAVDSSLWFIDAVGRHLRTCGDLDLVSAVYCRMDTVVKAYTAGTSFGIGTDANGLLRQGVPGVAMTWMDAVLDGQPVTPRQGKAVEINALWISALGLMAEFARQLGRDPSPYLALRRTACESFRREFVTSTGLWDVIPRGSDSLLDETRPNQVFAASLPCGPMTNQDDAGLIVEACQQLVTPLGLRTLHPKARGYRRSHRGNVIERDLAYHQGTVWPWLTGHYADARRRARMSVSGLADGLVAHLSEAGVGSVSETAEGDAPHAPTGCPFQAWSVAELLRLVRACRQG
jgi:predicted glycogen debranching enzyme